MPMARRLPPPLSTLPLSVCPWRNPEVGRPRISEGKTVQSTGEDTICPWQEDSHPLFLPFPCPYAHGELSTLPLSGFPWREVKIQGGKSVRPTRKPKSLLRMTGESLLR